MLRSPLTFPRFFAVLMSLCAVVVARPAQGMIDQNGNGMSDVWETIYGSGFDPNATDGSGMTYLQESLAGLAPGNPNSFLRASVSTSGTNMVVSWPSVAGKQYQLQASSVLAGGAWSAVGDPVSGTGLVLSSTLPMAAPASFFRVSVSDTDANADGVTDWEALQFHLDPANAYSNGHLDANGQPLSDFSYLTTALSATNVVTIVATKPGATIPDSGPATDAGLITITRSGNLNALTIPLQVSSPAASGTDYVALPSAVTLPMGVNSATLSVTPLASSHLLAGTPVVAAVAPSSAYQPGASGSATVILYPSTTPAGTGLTGFYYASSGTNYADTANFSPATLQVTRTDPQVNFYWGTGQPYTQVRRNNFSASWDGQIAPASTGNYLFALQADAGARMYINNQLVLDAWAANASTAAPVPSGPVPLTSGSLCQVHVEYWGNNDPSSIYLTWQPPTATSFSTIPNGSVFRPGTSGSTGWNASYYNNSTLSGTPAFSTVEKSLFWNWGTGSPDPAIPPTHYSVRWRGQVQPQYSEPYTFVTHTDDGVMLRVNGQLLASDWAVHNAFDRTSDYTINLQAGVRYDIQVDYFHDKLSTAQAILSWYSPSQTQQIIPQNRLYPASLPAAPPAITSPGSAVALVGGSFNYQVSASNPGTNFTVSGLPAGLVFDPVTGLISGIPTQPGTYTVIITATNGAGSGSAALTIQAVATGGGITRQVWPGITGTNVADIPLATTPAVTGTLTSLEGPSNYDSNYGEQIAGYLTAPVTGNYYFWLAGNSRAELWISNDADPVNSVKRASVETATTPRNWTAAAGQQSPWLALVAGQKYYIQVLHKFGDGTGDNIAVGWLRPDQTGTSASEVVPGYALSPYTPPPNTAPPGTLYSSTMLAEASVATGGVGAATLTVSPDQASATLAYNFSNLTSPVSDTQLVSDPYLSNPSQVIFDVTKLARQNADGSYTFKLGATGSLSAADVQEIIREGKAFLVIGTANHPSGEIRGNFTLANGAQSFSPPPAPQAWTDDHATDAGASRFLAQATFGPAPAEIARVQALGYSAWIDDQFSRPVSHHLPYVLANPSPFLSPLYPDTLAFNSWWQQSIAAPDQLRQRVAFALSEILVISDMGVLSNNSIYLSSYYDTLLDGAFGNYHDLLKAVTLTPAMGNYLTMRNNSKANYATGMHPDENYAREINQLFSIGLYRLWPDGTLVENAAGNLVPTYTQATVQGFAAAFTGWNYHQRSPERPPPRQLVSARRFYGPDDPRSHVHDLGPKLTLDNVVLPPASGSQADPSNAAFDNYCSGDLDAAIGVIFNHQNVGPFICRQLIQRLVTSNPSRDYLYRVVQAFNDNGSGVRGDLQAVVKAILLDYEARSPTAAALPGYGKQREPLLRVTAPARFFASTLSLSGSYSQSGGPQIVITSSTATRLSPGDVVVLNFFPPGRPLPYSGNYTVTAASGNAFTVNAAGITSGTYTQTGTTITVSIESWLVRREPGYLTFPSGGAVSGTYTVASVPDSTHLTVTSANPATLSGTVLIGNSPAAMPFPPPAARPRNQYGQHDAESRVEPGGCGLYQLYRRNRRQPAPFPC